MAFTDDLDSIGEKHQRGTNSTETRICCPFCTDYGETADERFRLNVNTARDTAFCFNCKYSAKENARHRVLDKLGVTAISDVEISDSDIAPEPEIVDHWPTDAIPAAGSKERDSREWRGRRYLKKRGITNEEMILYKIHVGISGRFKERILFPVVKKSTIVGFASRDFSGQATAKYLNSRGTKYVWGYDASASIFVISEGAIKGIFVRRALLAMNYLPKWCSISPLGSAITDSQIGQLTTRRVSKVIILPDPDTPGLLGAKRIADKLSEQDIDVELVWPQPRKQADEYKLEKLIDVLSNTRAYTTTLRNQIKAQTAFGKNLQPYA